MRKYRKNVYKLSNAYYLSYIFNNGVFNRESQECKVNIKIIKSILFDTHNILLLTEYVVLDMFGQCL